MSKIKIPCQIEDQVWDCTVNNYEEYQGYKKANVSGRGSSIDFLYGTTNDYNWIALPVQEIATTLSSFTDTFWNSEKLTSLIGEVDAMTIACALSHLAINNSSKEISMKERSKTLRK